MAGFKRIFSVLTIIVLNLNFCFAEEREILVTMTRGSSFAKLPGKSPYRLKQGKILFSPDLTFLTLGDGQVFFKTEDETEIRMKQDSIVVLHSGWFEIRKGCVGVRRNKVFDKRIVSPHLEMNLNNGTLVFKISQVLTRVAAVKGQAYVINPRQTQRLLMVTNEEIAAGNGMFSRIYKQTDELRYTWYWVDAFKEPGLKQRQE
jgi:hypothetical protein